MANLVLDPSKSHLLLFYIARLYFLLVFSSDIYAKRCSFVRYMNVRPISLKVRNEIVEYKDLKYGL